MTPTFVLSPLDVLIASHLTEHRIVRMTPAGAACDLCHRLLNVMEWAEPCAGLDPVPTQPISIPS